MHFQIFGDAPISRPSLSLLADAAKPLDSKNPLARGTSLGAAYVKEFYHVFCLLEQVVKALVVQVTNVFQAFFQKVAAKTFFEYGNNF